MAMGVPVSETLLPILPWGHSEVELLGRVLILYLTRGATVLISTAVPTFQNPTSNTHGSSVSHLTNTCYCLFF